MDLEHTLAIIMPQGMPKQKEILKAIKKEGFLILNRRTLQLTAEQASDFFQERYGQLDFPLLVVSASVGPVVVLCLGRPHAVEVLNELVGPCDIPKAKAEAPRSLNALYGNEDCNLSALHSSKDIPAAKREIHYFFPQAHVEPEVRQGIKFLERELNPLLKKGLVEMMKEKPVEPMLWLADWLLRNNPNKPQVQEHLRCPQF